MQNEILTDVPTVLYKYRDWSLNFHRDLLFKRELYFSAFSQFNDPFDGTIPYTIDPSQLTPDNIFRKYYEMEKERNPTWSDALIHESVHQWQQKGLFFDDKHLEEFHSYRIKRLEDHGILSLSKNRNNFLMWSHYTNSHMGFVLGFDKVQLWNDTHKQPGCAFCDVIYEDDFPTINLFADPVATAIRLLITKSKESWQYEKEYRIIKIGFARQKIILSDQTIVEVILGCKMLQQDKNSIIAFVTQEMPHMKIYESVLSKTKFETDIQRIF